MALNFRNRRKAECQRTLLDRLIIESFELSESSWSFALFMRVLPVFSARPFFSLLAKFGEWRQNGVKKFKSHA